MARRGGAAPQLHPHSEVLRAVFQQGWKYKQKSLLAPRPLARTSVLPPCLLLWGIMLWLNLIQKEVFLAEDGKL